MPKTAKGDVQPLYRAGSKWSSPLIEQCPSCRRPKESTSAFCSLHQSAVHNLQSQYELWQFAFGGNLSKDEYYKRLRELPETGNAVKEVIELLLRKPGVT